MVVAVWNHEMKVSWFRFFIENGEKEIVFMPKTKLQNIIFT